MFAMSKCVLVLLQLCQQQTSLEKNVARTPVEMISRIILRIILRIVSVYTEVLFICFDLYSDYYVAAVTR